MRMCVRNVCPSSRWMSRCFPRASTAATVHPLSAETREPRPGTPLRAATTRCPTSARDSVRAARWMVSPSGTAIRVASATHVSWA